MRDQIQGAVNSTINAAVEAIEDPASVAERARQLAEASRVMTELATRRIVATPWNSTPVTQDRVVAWTRQSFSDFRAIRSAFGGSVNDVVLAMLTEGAARYLQHHGYAVEGQQLCIGCPVNVRHKSEKSSLGNRVSMMFPTAPAAPMDIIERLKLINEETERIKAAGSAQALEAIMRLGDAIPPSMIGPAARAATTMMDVAGRMAKWTDWKPRPDGFGLPAFGINFIATNVPGVQVPQYINGHVCLDMVPLVPLGATMGYAVAILSYYKSLYFGMMADPRVMPDVALMKAFVDDAFAEMKRRCAEKSAEKAEQEPERKSASGGVRGRVNHFIECGTRRGFRTSLGRGDRPHSRTPSISSLLGIKTKLCDADGRATNWRFATTMKSGASRSMTIGDGSSSSRSKAHRPD